MSAAKATKRSNPVGRGAAAIKKAARKVGASKGPAASPAKKTAAKKTAAKKTAAKKTAAKKTAAKKTAAKKTAAKKAPAKKTAAKKAPAKKTAAKKAPAKKTAAKKAPAKKAPGKKATTARQAAVLAVKPDERPWSARELNEVRGELQYDRDRLVREIDIAERDLQDLLRGGVDGAGNDQADVGSNSLERDAEMSLAANQREMLLQVVKALGRIEDGTYGRCEMCGNPIGKMRLMAFPRATLCMACKQREERR